MATARASGLKEGIKENFVKLCSYIDVNEFFLSILLSGGVINPDEKATVQRVGIIQSQRVEELLLLMLCKPESYVEKFTNALRASCDSNAADGDSQAADLIQCCRIDDSSSVATSEERNCEENLNEELRGKFELVVQELSEIMDNLTVRRHLFQNDVLKRCDYERIIKDYACNQIMMNAVSKSLNPRSYIILRDILRQDPVQYGHVLDKLESVDTTAGYLKQAELVKWFTVDTGVWGIAVIDDRLFVAQQNKDYVDVYDTKTFERIEQLDVKGLVFTADMIADIPDRVLIISDRYGQKSSNGSYLPGIYVKSIYSPFRQEFHSFKTQPGGLSLTNDRRLVVISEKKNEAHEIIIFKRMDMSLTELRRIDLNDFERYVLKAVELPGESGTSTYAVTQVHKSTDTHCLLLVQVTEGCEKGTECARFPGRWETRSEFKLREPYSIVLDARGNLIVNDCHNHRILLFDQSLNLIRELIPNNSSVVFENGSDDAGKVKLNCPRRICFDESHGILCVAQGGSGSKDSSSSKPVFGEISVCRVKSKSCSSLE